MFFHNFLPMYPRLVGAYLNINIKGWLWQKMPVSIFQLYLTWLVADIVTYAALYGSCREAKACWTSSRAQFWSRVTIQFSPFLKRRFLWCDLNSGGIRLQLKHQMGTFTSMQIRIITTPNTLRTLRYSQLLVYLIHKMSILRTLPIYPTLCVFFQPSNYPTNIPFIQTF